MEEDAFKLLSETQTYEAIANITPHPEEMVWGVSVRSLKRNSMEWKTFDFKGGRTRLGRKIGDILEGDRFKCALCVGTGILPRTKGTKCPVCKGSGIVSLTGPAMVCAYCKGRGDYPARTNLTCTVCGGKGLVSIANPVQICGHCRGTGAEPSNKLPCLECKGKGVVTK